MAGTEGLILIFRNVYRSYTSDMGFVFVLVDCIGQVKLPQQMYKLQAHRSGVLIWVMQESCCQAFGHNIRPA